jgi:hypothetical protein
MTPLDIRQKSKYLPYVVINGIRCYWFVEAVKDNYLRRNLTVKRGCFDSNEDNGWFETEEDAQYAITQYQLKEKDMLTTLGKAPLETLVLDTIYAMMSEEALFTAHDVTRRLRAENPSTLILHDVVRDFMNGWATKGGMVIDGWARQLVTIGPGTEAFVYGPEGEDLTKYAGYVIPQPVATIIKTTQPVVVPSTFGGMTV